jgi:polyhydroxyalkanoate synthesis regulator phasin
MVVFMLEERLQKAKERLNAYYEAELAVLAGQEYRIGSRVLRRADLPSIREAINELERLVYQLEAQLNGNTTIRSRRVVLRDI